MDDVGPYLKLPDGTVYRDRASAAHRLWRAQPHSEGIQWVLNALPRRQGRGGQIVRSRTPERTLDALVSYGLVFAGMTRVAAAAEVLKFAGYSSRDPARYAETNSRIWRELRLPAVRA